MSKAGLMKASHDGTLQIGNLVIDCSVLNDGTRVLSYRSVNRSLGKSEKWNKKGATELPPFISQKELKDFIPRELSAPLSNPIEYKPLHGGRTAYGVPAELLPEICDVWLRAREDGALKSKKSLASAKQAEILMRGLAHVGIIALVDEATGYQETRDRQELQKILACYISKELLPWSLKFPHEFYKEMFRLNGWSYNASSKRKKPMLAGKYTKEWIYDKLPNGVIEELSKRNPRNEATGRREHHHHRFLTEDVGNPHLGKQIAAVTTLMRASANMATFKRLFARAFGGQQQMDIDNEE